MGEHLLIVDIERSLVDQDSPDEERSRSEIMLEVTFMISREMSLFFSSSKINFLFFELYKHLKKKLYFFSGRVSGLWTSLGLTHLVGYFWGPLYTIQFTISKSIF